MISKTSMLKITFSAMIIAIYVIIMFVSQWFAFGPIQIRIATSLYALPSIFPFLVIPLALANGLSNTLFGGLGIIDMVGGFVVGLLTSGMVYLIRRIKLNDWLIAFPIIFIPSLVVPIWLTPILASFPNGETITYTALATSLIIGQLIPGVSGVILVKALKKRNISFQSLKKHNRIVEEEYD